MSAENKNPVLPPPLPPGIGIEVSPRSGLGWARKALRLSHPAILVFSGIAILLWLLQMAYFMQEDADASYPGDGQQGVFLRWIDRSMSGEVGAIERPEWQRLLGGATDEETILEELYWTVQLGEERGVFNRYGEAVAAVVYLANDDDEFAEEVIEWAWKKKKQDSKAGILLGSLRQLMSHKAGEENGADLEASGARLVEDMVARSDYRWWNLWVLDEINQLTGGSLGEELVEVEERPSKLFDIGLGASVFVWAVNLLSLIALFLAWRWWRSGNLGWPKRRWVSLGVGVIGACGIFCAVDLFGVWVLGTVYSFLWYIPWVWEVERQVDLVYEMVWRLAPLVLIPLLLSYRPRNWLRFFGLVTNSANRVFPKLVVLAFAGFGVISLFEWATSFLGGDSYAVDPVDYLLPEERGWFGLFYGLLTACVAAPLGEEVAYRGLLLPAMVGRFGRWAGLVGTSVLFALAHMQYDLIGLIQVGFMGLVAGWLYLRTQSLWCPILLHVLQNFVATIVPWTYFFLPIG